MTQQSPQAVVIGGGAAGLFGAIAIAEANPHRRVTLLEASRSPLAKVRISGGGRCNVTHACFDPKTLVQHYPRGGKALLGAFNQFQPKDTVDWFEQRGVRLKTEADGRIFPTSDDSATIADCLLHTAAELGVRLRTDAPVASVERSDEGFIIWLKSGERSTGDRLLLATGSHPVGYRLAQRLGHRLEPPVPSLFTFNVPDPALCDLAGVSMPIVQVKLRTAAQSLEQTGALLITHWGLSGPAVLKLSAWGARQLHDCRYQADLQINWLPPHNPETLGQAILQAKDQQPRRSIASYCPVEMPRRLWQYILDRAGFDSSKRWAELSKKQINRLAIELTQGSYHMTGKGLFKEEFVTCGGVLLKEVQFKTMESRCCPGLHFAGEILDIDGVTGGFNFQSAWTTAWIAGRAMAAD